MIPQSVSDVFLTQGVIGAVALIALLVAAFLYRENSKQREKYETVIQKLNEDRIAEMRAGMSEMAKAMSTVESANNNFEAALSMLSKRPT